jgi:hypothetical protein
MRHREPASGGFGSRFDHGSRRAASDHFTLARTQNDWLHSFKRGTSRYPMQTLADRLRVAHLPGS